MTEFIFRSDGYRRAVEATVTALTPEGGIVLDRTVFYAASGGQPGDTGQLETSGGAFIKLSATVHPDGDKTAIVHVPAADQAPPAVGDTVVATLDWDRRYRLMRMHTALHLLSVVLPFPVTGGAVGEEKGRLDFDMAAVPENLAELEEALNQYVGEDHPVTDEWITDAQLAANPELVKTMKAKPPMGQGRVRLVRIGDLDLQPCGGTHVRNTGEIGPLRFGKIEKKGAINRRVALLFAP